MRVSGHDHVSLPVSSAGSPLAARAARVLPGGASVSVAHGQAGRAERIGAPSLGVTRMLELYRENERPYARPQLSSFHVHV